MPGRPAGWPPLQRMGPFLTLGWVAYLAWIAAFVLDVATASRLQRPAVAVAVTVTVLVVPLGDAIGPGRPLLSVLAALVVLGLPSLLRPGWTRARLPRWLLNSLLSEPVAKPSICAPGRSPARQTGQVRARQLSRSLTNDTGLGHPGQRSRSGRPSVRGLPPSRLVVEGRGSIRHLSSTRNGVASARRRSERRSLII